MLAATAGTGQFVLGQFVDDFDAGKISRQGFALATAFDRCNDLFVGVADGRHRLAFWLIEQCQLRRVGFDRLFGLASEQTVAQQLDLFFQINDVGGVSFFGVLRFKQHLLKQNGIVRKIFRHQFHARIIPVRRRILELKPCADGYARDQIHPVTSSIPGPSARWSRPSHRERF
ncbi:hypothetical protein ALP73_200371 [Pseudomonas coronafaciens pv. garcae]|nr:hypothetical protein ALP73_200371 [Pseudomonas coronafaciens pv. garcae]